jgi:nitrate reductase gamma subunit
MVLPAKSVLCMPCHAATFSVGDATTIVSLLVFLAGVAGLCVVWFSGRTTANRKAVPAPADRRRTAPGISAGGIFALGMFHVLGTLVFDVFLQRRLFRQSRARWLIHALIFFPFVFRFLWGITALLTSLRMPESSLPWTLLDRSDPLNGLLFDVSGVSILLGVTLAALRGIIGKPGPAAAGLPSPGRLALSLIGGTVLIGFVLEGMRIAMTGTPADSAAAFLGYGLSRLFVNVSNLPDIYGTVWYLHAIAAGAFIACLPFSHLFHIIMAPVVMAGNAMARSREHKVKGVGHVGRP